MTSHCRTTGHLHLTDDIIHIVILSGLDDPKDLAAMASQCRRLRQLIHDSPIWRCQRRWTAYGIPWDLVDGHGWAEVYRQLDALPDMVLRSVGGSCEVNKNWSELEIHEQQNIHNSGTVSEEFAYCMLAVFYIDVHAAIKDAAVLDRESYAAAVLRRDLHPWLAETPKVVYWYGANLRGLKYVKPYKYPECPEVMDELAWRRSAAEFLPQVMAGGTDLTGYTSALHDLAVTAARFDGWLREQVLVGGVGKPTPPRGIGWKHIDALPESHWWWRITPAPGPDSDFYNDSDGDSQ